MKEVQEATAETRRVLKADMVWGIIWVILGVFVILYSMPYAEVPSFDPIGAAYLPRLLGSGISILGLGLFLDSYFKYRKLLPSKSPELTHEKRSPNQPAYQGTVRILLSVVTCILYIVLIQPVGYILVTPAFIAAIMKIYGESNKRRIASMSIGMTAALYAVFAIGLKVLLPLGIFELILP